MTTTTLQQGLNEVVKNKVERMIAGKATTVQATVERLINEGKIQQDYIAPIGVNLRNKGDKPVITFAANGHVNMAMPEGNFTLHDNAIGQIADKFGIPARYLRQLAAGDEWQRHLASNILNEHSGWTERSRVLVRSVGQEVRAVLSDSYRRINSIDILTAFMEESLRHDAVVADAYMNDTNVWAETILPQPFEVHTDKNGIVLLYMGARFSTSDYGNGSVDMRTFMLNGVCLNGMVRESVMRQVHLGSKLPDNLRLSERTYKLDTKTTVSAVKDLTRGLFGKESIKRRAFEVERASATDVDFEVELKKLVKGGKLLKTESDSVEKLIMNNNPEDGVQGAATLWKLTQAITAHARELTPERTRELHEISGDLMNRVRV